MVDVVTNHKNLENFVTTKLLTRQQAHWSEFLSQFNMVIHFCPRKLDAKPDSLTRHWDVYPKRGIRTTPTSILTISDWSSHRNSLLHASGLVSCLT